MAINTEITRIAGAKADIKTAIEAKGVSVPSNALIDSYDDYVAQISGGGGNQDLIDLIERDITTLTIPSGTTSIGQQAFRECFSLASVTIPSGVTSIGTSAFNSCTSLITLTIPSSVTNIGNYVFNGCTSLASVTFDSPSSVTSMGSNVFNGCTSLGSITLPSSVTNIGDRAFFGCTSLTTVTCEATTPPTLGSQVFFNSYLIAHVYVPASSVETYKAAGGWSTYASIIEAIPSA